MALREVYKNQMTIQWALCLAPLIIIRLRCLLHIYIYTYIYTYIYIYISRSTLICAVVCDKEIETEPFNRCSLRAARIRRSGFDASYVYAYVAYMENIYTHLYTCIHIYICLLSIYPSMYPSLYLYSTYPSTNLS